MWLRKELVFPALGAGLACLLCAACTEPSPLYGTWADNRGNTFSFFEDGTFSAKVTVVGEFKEDFEGNYSVLLNALALNCTNVALRVVTEWDIQGNMFYFDWTNKEGAIIAMTLYKVSN